MKEVLMVFLLFTNGELDQERILVGPDMKTCLKEAPGVYDRADKALEKGQLFQVWCLNPKTHEAVYIVDGVETGIL